MVDNKGTWLLWLKIFGVLTAVLLAFAALATIKVLFIPVLVAIILNVLLAPIASALERKGISRGAAVMVMFLATAALFALVLLFLPQKIGNEIDVLKAKWPEAQLKLLSLLHDAQSFINGRVPDDRQVELVQSVPFKLKTLANEYVSNIPEMLEQAVLAVVLIPIFTYFLLRDGRALKKGLIAAVPNRYFEMTLNIFYRVNQQVSNYLRGLVMEAFIDATIASLILLAAGIPNAIAIGLVAGSTTIMPLVGIIVSLAVCPLIAVFSATGNLLAIVSVVAIAIVVTHLLDNVVVAPLIMGHSVHMHPALVITSIILGGRFFGVLGIVLAVPGMSILQVLVQEGYRGVKSYEYYLKL